MQLSSGEGGTEEKKHKKTKTREDAKHVPIDGSVAVAAIDSGTFGGLTGSQKTQIKSRKMQLAPLAN